MPDTVGLEQHETTSLWGIAKRASACKDHRFQDLYRCLDANLLLDCWDDLNKKAASGVDEVTAQAYEQDLIRLRRYRVHATGRFLIQIAPAVQQQVGVQAPIEVLKTMVFAG